MASYEKRGNTWRYRISLGKDAETGKYKYISNSGFKRKSDAKHHAEMVERQLEMAIISHRPHLHLNRLLTIGYHNMLTK